MPPIIRSDFPYPLRTISGQVDVEADSVNTNNLNVSGDATIKNLYVSGITNIPGGVIDLDDITANTLVVNNETTLKGPTVIEGLVTLSGGLSAPLAVTSGGTGVTTATGSGSIVKTTGPTISAAVLNGSTGTSLTMTGVISTTNNTTASSTTSGSIITSGGIGVGGAVYTNGLRSVGNIIGDAQLQTSGKITCLDTTESTSESTGSITTAGGLATLKNIYGGGRLVTAGYLQTDSYFNASSASNGSLRVTNGGMGCAQDCFVGGNVSVNSTTDTSNATTGSLVTAGGVGIAKAVYAGGTVRGNRLLSASDVTCYSVKLPSNAPSTAVDSTGTTLRINGVSDFDDVEIVNLSTVNSFPFVYEIGTFTPTFIPINPADDADFPLLINTTYVTQNGRYTRVGNALTIYVEVEWTSFNNANFIGIALEKGVPYTIGAACCAIYGLSYNMEPVTPLGLQDGIPISTFNAVTERFEQLNWSDGTSRVPYLFVNGSGPLIGVYRIAYTMQCYVA